MVKPIAELDPDEYDDESWTRGATTTSCRRRVGLGEGTRPRRVRRAARA
jgi:hypothetical protein